MGWLLEKLLSTVSYVTVRYFIFAGTAFFLFYILFKKTFFFRKIQPTFPALKDHQRDIIYSLITVVIFSSVAVLTLILLKPYSNIYESIHDFGNGYYLFSFIWMFFLHDTYFYWMHRFLHHPRLFKKVHLIHHRSTNPSPWTSYAFHPIEAIFEAGIIPVIAFTLPVHTSAVVLFLLFQFIYNVYGHLGFELYPKGFHKTVVGKWVNTSVSHNMHHHHFHGNYGLYLLIWDRLMGTLREDYDTSYEQVTQANKKLNQ